MAQLLRPKKEQKKRSVINNNLKNLFTPDADRIDKKLITSGVTPMPYHLNHHRYDIL
jgi:hypothetical protein